MALSLMLKCFFCEITLLLWNTRTESKRSLAFTLEKQACHIEVVRAVIQYT